MSTGTSTCHVCDDSAIPTLDLLEHFRLLHPEVHAELVESGKIVIVDGDTDIRP